MQDPLMMITGLIADAMSPEMIADEMERSIQHFRSTGNFQKIQFVAMLIQHKIVIQQHGSVEKMMSEFDQFRAVEKAFEHTKNKS